MRKRFKKRLLGIILTILMVVSVIPVQQVQPVKAAAGDTIQEGTTIYLRPNAATTWIKDNAVMAFKTSADNKQSEIVVMTKMDDGLTWYGKTTAEATNIDFLRLNPKNKDVWNEAGTWPGLERGKNLYTFALHTGVTPTGMWTTYSNTGSETTSYFNVNATLVDYFNNGRVEQPKNTLYNEGNMTGEKNAPYSQLNQWISNLQGYALNGVADSKNDNAPVPLYFGDLLHAKQAGGNLTWYWQGANVAFGPNKETASKDVAQGIVGKNLDDGNLITSYTNENGDPVKVPFFNEDAYPNQSKYMRFYNNLQFPFTKTTNDKGVSTYSFDSERNTVHYDYENNKIVRDDTIKIHDVGGDTGYFPFNSVDPSAKDNLNYGFGTQFTIPFTVTETGKNVDGTPITFKFTGDDDVWVYIDGALVLDMGGAHCKAEGEINFATQMATITTGTSNAKLGNQATAGGRVKAEDNGNRTVDFKNITVKKSDGKTISLADYMKESGKVHELKMYYMERGMWDSNMSISYSFVPLPSGLTLSKTLDTKDVNAGLKNAVQGLDKFDFNIQTRNLKAREANYSDVDNLGYTLYDYNDNTYPGQVAKNSTATFSSSYYASEFIDTTDENNSSAFYAGTGFKITESIPKCTKLQYDETKTKWGVYDSAISREAIEQKDSSNVAIFNMGDANSSEMDVVNRYVNFVNTPKVGSLSVEKKYEGDALKDKTFGFTVKVDLTGGDYYDSYKLEYTGSQNNGTTDENGHFTLKAGEKITFAGIPAGATYKVVEDAPKADDTWVQDTTSKVTGTIKADDTAEASVTNKPKTTTKDYVIYAEAGKPVTYAPDGVTIKELTKTTTDDTDITTNVNGGKGEFTPTSPNKKYDVAYKGTTTDKGDFEGTITVLTYQATDKVYVFDYGLESNIADTTTGDGLFQDGTFYNKYATDDMATTAKLGTIAAAKENTQTEITTISDSDIAINDDGSATGAVTFKPTAFMDKVENYTYTADITKNGATLDSENPETGTTVHGTIKTMPANVVYYEDNFNKDGKDDSAVKIIYSGTTTTDRSTDGTDVKLEQSNDQSEQYGHDNAYAKGDKYSSGSSTKMEKSATATFTFKGTGFDIISRTNTKTGTIGVKVYKGEKASGEPIRNIPLITYYDDGDLYQVPVIHETDFDYGTYTVVVEVKSYNPEGIVFYLDGVRIYGPLDDKEYTDDKGNITYDSDNYLESEVDAVINEIRPMIIGNTADETKDNHAMLMQYQPRGNAVLSAGGNTVVETLDGTVPEGATKTTADFERYWKWGPNNELYLEPGNAVGFLIPVEYYDLTDSHTTFQIGAKTTSEKAVTLKTILPDGTEAKDSPITVNSATDMYYKINVTEDMKITVDDTEYYQVVIANTAGGTVSLTNIKSTCDPKLFGVPAVDTTAMRMMAASMISAFSTKDEVVSEAAFATVVRSGRDATLAVTSTVGVEKLKITDSNGQVMDNSTLKISYTDKVLNGNKLRTWRVKFKPNLKRGKYKYTVEGITAENKATVRIGTPTLTVR